ncbi:hypothetical protein AV530_005259 [Patagioenas fasciata monilis]|uniref:Uncharacterized protein n=1 Tax=Patagioenas fasciata monilis TaxID=372326 RepID=A0A1V4JKW8_PATFA|nr:hypothetical protein AV530_005259 [Patagioenas fasciata monilis]
MRNSARIPALCHSQDPGVLHPLLSCSAGPLRANCQAGPLGSARLQHIQLHCQRQQHRKLYGTNRRISVLGCYGQDQVWNVAISCTDGPRDMLHE